GSNRRSGGVRRRSDPAADCADDLHARDAGPAADGAFARDRIRSAAALGRSNYRRSGFGNDSHADRPARTFLDVARPAGSSRTLNLWLGLALRFRNSVCFRSRKSEWCPRNWQKPQGMPLRQEFFNPDETKTYE